MKRNSQAVWSIRTYYSIVLRTLCEGCGYQTKTELQEIVRQQVGRFSRLDLQEIPCGQGGSIPRWRNRLAWALVSLRRAGLIQTRKEWVVLESHASARGRPMSDQHEAMLLWARNSRPKQVQEVLQGPHSLDGNVRRIHLSLPKPLSRL